MEQEQGKEKIAQAIIKVMQSIKGIEKSQTIGIGSSSYKGVPDQEVKKIIGKAMVEQGLCILPIDSEATIKIERWEEVDQYSNSTPKATKIKQSVFTEVKTKYLLLHTSGQNIVLSGYGHGIDSQDKGAGKASTYALKYVLLYIFLVPTGKIDDSDNEHSDNHQTPAVKQPEDKKQVSAEKSFVQDPIEKIKACKNMAELTPLWNSMPAIQQASEHITKAFKDIQREWKKTETGQR